MELVLRTLFVVPRPIASHYPLGAGVAGSELHLAQREYDVRLRYNSFGFREDEFPLEKRPGETRLLVLGDSFAEGIGVAEEARFADILEQDLARTWDGDVVVLAAGQMATGPSSYLRNLLDFGIALAPDVVIMAIYVGNDFSSPGRVPARSAPVRDTLPPDPLAARGSYLGLLTLPYTRAALEQLLLGETLLHRRPRRSSPWEVGYGKPFSRDFFFQALRAFGVRPEEFDAATARMDPDLVADFVAGRMNPAFFVAALAEQIAEQRGSPVRPKPVDVQRAVDGVLPLVERAQAVLRERGIALLVVVIPDVHEIQRRQHEDFLARIGTRPSAVMRSTADVRRLFVRALNERGIATVDLAEPLRAAGEPTFHVMDGHFNEAGHRVAAREIARALVPLVPRPPSAGAP